MALIDESKIRRHRIARGTLQENGARKIAVRFEPEKFRAVLNEAMRRNRSFAEQVRFFVDEGLKHNRA